MWYCFYLRTSVAFFIKIIVIVIVIVKSVSADLEQNQLEVMSVLEFDFKLTP